MLAEIIYNLIIIVCVMCTYTGSSQTKLLPIYMVTLHLSPQWKLQVHSNNGGNSETFE